MPTDLPEDLSNLLGPQGASPKPGQSIQPTNIRGDIDATRQTLVQAGAEFTGVADVDRWWRGEINLGALAGSLLATAVPEVKEFNPLEKAVPYTTVLPKYAEQIFLEGDATIYKLQKPGRWPTFVATAPSGEAYQFKDFEAAKKWVAPPEVQRPDPANPMELPPWEEPIKAYHGSSSDFSQFDVSQIGTGQGAQSYGHGLYFAEEPKVAESYKQEGHFAPGEGVASDVMSMFGGDRKAAIAELEDRIAANKKRSHPGMILGAWAKDDQAALDFLTSGKNPKSLKGHMYEVNIKADPEHFLDWDKPLREQSKHVQSALRKDIEADIKQQQKARDEILERERMAAQGKAGRFQRRLLPFEIEKYKQPLDPDTMVGAEMYRRFGVPAETHAEGHVKSAEALKKAGIPGIRYLDQGSRGMDPAVVEANLADAKRRLAEFQGQKYKQPYNEDMRKEYVRRYEDEIARHEKNLEEAKKQKRTYNYVVFDDKLIDIVKKFGLAGLIAGGGYHYQQTQQ